ncbi:MAG: DNA repair protein RecN [Eubacterium sp.]|nr:DNA repair protein RecN [Eubacterium sp.]
MIDHISIRNFAIIENTEIDLRDGLNVITGETGAGKSIVIEAVSLALGARADSSFIRHGEEKAIVELSAEIGDEDFVISREVSFAGKNVCRINGRMATLAEVQELAHKIADIHGQYDNQLLLDPAHHLDLVDAYRMAQTGPALSEFKEAYDAYKTIRADYDALIKSATENRRKQDFYQFEIKEIDKVSPKPGEDKELEDRISILENSEVIYNALNSSRSMLDSEDSGILSMLGTVQENLSHVSRYSDQLKKLSDEIGEACFSLQSSSDEMRSICEMTDFSPVELDKAISRLDEIDDLKKKYGETIDDVLSYRDRISRELDTIENYDDRKKSLEASLETAKKDLMAKASVLTEVRKENAALLGSAIQEELRDLNFTDSTLKIEIRKAPAITHTGADEAEILLSANRGEPLKPLARIASGGEISRIMLAIKNVTGSHFDVPTMIFDEIDAGISGITASVVARKLRAIAKDHQIICITHLPQIAAAGTSNYRIFKESDETSTYTHVERLDEDKKTAEIARLLGGENITDTTLASARELVDSFSSK